MDEFIVEDPLSGYRCIPKEGAEFFMSLCQDGLHAFVYVGMIDADKNVHTLSIVGKVTSKLKGINIVRGILGSKVCPHETETYLSDEYGYRSRKRTHNIRHKSFALSYQQYLQYLSIISPYNTEDDAYYFYDISQDSKNYYLTLCGLGDKTAERKLEQANPNDFSFSNTCRNTAVELVERTMGQKMVDNLFKLFFIPLPFNAEIRKGTLVADRLHIFPSPPPANLKNENKKLYDMMSSLYQCMNNIATHSSTSKEDDYNKFAKLKALYGQLLSQAPEQPLESYIKMIQDWEKENTSVIDKYRNTNWTSYLARDLFGFKTNTRQVIDRILNKKLLNPC